MFAFNNTKKHDRKYKLKVLPASLTTFPKIKSKVKTKGVFYMLSDYNQGFLKKLEFIISQWIFFVDFQKTRCSSASTCNRTGPAPLCLLKPTHFGQHSAGILIFFFLLALNLNRNNKKEKNPTYSVISPPWQHRTTQSLSNASYPL